MELHKLLQEAYETSKHWHFPVFAGLIAHLRLGREQRIHMKNSGLGEIPGDNIPPKEILDSLSFRRGP